ncbi:MAG TPA: KGG domain-containing protein [Candidatus Saccharimonadia bacterium]|nr:KGG domain-containing protein [Candidatus Saccharimonadia bacterium]
MAMTHKNPGNFANNPKRASDAGKKGAANQKIEDKRRGGMNSHKNR